MLSQYEADIIHKGVEISWSAWTKMRGGKFVSGDVKYQKTDGEKGFEQIFSVNIADNQEFRVRQMVSFIKAGIMPGSIIITPNTKPENLAEILAGKGFSIKDGPVGMMLYLDGYNQSLPEIPNFTVERVTEQEQLAEWLNIVVTALFGYDIVTLEQFSDVLALDNTYFYLGLSDNKPVTACMTITVGDTSVLEMVATLKEYRRRGFATRAVNMALSDLRDMGIKTVSLRAEPDGVGVYKSLGFREGFKVTVASCNSEAVKS